ncbi:MAG TPA: threonine/serine dehydratase [Candidatus Limnocylindrales bacterium]|nr:threonine/serine dehydratase [Candidatus Limnocylindrales bacterium]
MADLIASPERIAAARERMAGKVHRTPMLSSSTAAAFVRAQTGVRLADDRVYLKAEHLQKTGSYKPRGMVNKVATLGLDERQRGVITISAGNAAQGYAYAGHVEGVPITVVMPLAANPAKVAACRGYGAEVILIGSTFEESWAQMERIGAERGLVFCHPFDDLDVIAGQASVGLEILEDLPDVDLVIVGIGGGGLVSGVSTAIRRARPSARVVGVEPELANGMVLALAAGHPVNIAPRSVADGLNGPYAGERNIAAVQAFVEQVVVIDDATILAGMRFALERTKQVVEPAGAAGLGALLTGQIPIHDGERVCVILSGGNLDLTKLADYLERAAPLTAP